MSGLQPEATCKMYQAAEVARMVGVSKNTLLRWLRQGKVPETARDRNGWRVFSEEDVRRISAYARQIIPPDAFRASAKGAA